MVSNRLKRGEFNSSLGQFEVLGLPEMSASTLASFFMGFNGSERMKAAGSPKTGGGGGGGAGRKGKKKAKKSGGKPKAGKKKAAKKVAKKAAKKAKRK